MSDFRDPALDDEMRPEVDSAKVSASKENNGETTGLIAKGEFEADYLLRPGLDSHGFHSSGDLYVVPPNHLGNGNHSIECTDTEITELGAESLGVAGLFTF